MKRHKFFKSDTEAILEAAKRVRGGDKITRRDAEVYATWIRAALLEYDHLRLTVRSPKKKKLHTTAS